ncbi:putative 8-amino-7-oxononanoate synthase [Lyophyllum shimeji]|uniref:8-amino-7-oxononanoate synthase n=1 Tax=Lyophyllum shimeji TaxID=47721 RepID=A0A9P3Q0B5_LYOSH|nr:putative 8-amino-7-oxononanoate synthase [Lyophyllum shimeji]
MSDCSSSLANQLRSALASRSARRILRRLPDPDPIPSPSSSSTIDFTSNDYLSLSTSPHLRTLFLHKLSTAPRILGSGGSRLLTNGPAHAALESRLAKFFTCEQALLFNSGFDANVAVFSCLPQPGDVVVYDEYIHASVHDGLRASRARASHPFAHNSLPALRRVLDTVVRQEDSRLRDGEGSVFVAVESLYSMDGTFAPLQEIVEMLESIFPRGNAYLVVDEAHATGIYGPQGRGRVAELGLERKVLLRLCTFGKALAATGAVVLTNTLIRDYLVNYARPLIYTTSLSFANIIAADCAFDLLMDGTAQSLAHDLLALSTHFTAYLRALLAHAHIPPSVLSLPAHLSPPLPSLSPSLSPSPSPAPSPSPSPTPSPTPPPSPILPLLTPHPHALAHHLRTHHRLAARPITWPTVPRGAPRVRVCLRAALRREEVEGLARGCVCWARGVVEREGVVEGERQARTGSGRSEGCGWMEERERGWVECKL